MSKICIKYAYMVPIFVRGADRFPCVESKLIIVLLTLQLAVCT
jgi:hypothetical protein